MVFLPGDHVLDTNITVVNVTGSTLCGESSSLGNRAIVVCSGSVGLNFRSMLDFKIQSLAFTSCNRKLYWTYHVSNNALLLQSTQSAKLVNCSFHDNLSTVLVVNNTNITLSGNSQFIHNHWYEGGGITALSSHLTFTGNTAFLDNSNSLSWFWWCNLNVSQYSTQLQWNQQLHQKLSTLGWWCNFYKGQYCT